MEKVKFYKIALIFCLFFMLISLHMSYDSYSTSNSNGFEITESFKIKVSSNHQIITINNNYQLNQTASSGNGTLSNPYIIDSLTIDGQGYLYSILINNTDKYFTLKGCTVYNSSYGISINNVTNALITGNFISENLKAGIKVENSHNISILGNHIYKNRTYGAFIVNTNNTIIDNNLLWDNGYAGVYVNNSVYNNITLNIINDHKYPLVLENSNFTNIVNNTGEGNIYDIQEINSQNNYFEGNNFIKNVPPREEKNSNNSLEILKSVDFTLVLVFCLSFFALGLLINKYRSIYLK